MQGLVIHLLGRPRIELDGEPIAGRLPAKGLAMLCYLAALGTAQPRTTIPSLLWGALPPRVARANLRLALTRTGRVLGDALETDGATIGFSGRARVTVDLSGRPNQTNSAC